jgi:pyrophosphatase PpaX
LDGTLLDSIPGILASFGHVLGRFVPDRRFTRRDLIMVIGEPVEKQMLDFNGGDASLAARMVEEYRRHNREILPSMPLFAGVHAVLSALRSRGQIVGVVTSKGRTSAMVSLDGHGLMPHLDLVLTCDDTARHKPDPMPLSVAAERLGLRPGEIAYVGDSVHDMRCALAAGCRAVAALWGPFEREALAALDPHDLVEALPDLLEIAALRPA